jgi:glycogen debranching enzyme
MTKPLVFPRAHDEAADQDQFYIRTPASLADDRNLVLKQGESFVVLDRHGDIRPVGLAEEGLYHEGTRYLSRAMLRLDGHRLLLLSSAVKQDNTLIRVDGTNLDVDADGVNVPRGTLHVGRTIVLWKGSLHERVHLRNFGPVPITLKLEWRLAADYADIFEVRGTERAARGTMLPAVIDGSGLTLGYRGLDRVVRRTRVSLDPPPSEVTCTDVAMRVVLQPGGEDVCELRIDCERTDRRAVPVSFAVAERSAADALAATTGESCTITTSNQHFNEWLQRSMADLAMMTTDTESGPFPYAGVPWFSTPFGRDSLITAFECLWAMPALTRGVLRYLAATQATGYDAARDAQPGKILHEARTGEMAALGEIPFGRYYGSHDATPLFVMLAAACYDRTGDRAFIEDLWPHIDAALGWIERDGDPDGDGFVEYERRSLDGLVNQGWKDSHDAVFHHDGRLAEGSIALCEIEGYVYAAWVGAARLARVLGHAARADGLAAHAAALRDRFDAAFWCPEIGTYALALDGHKRPCAVRTSNAGQLLFTGIVPPERARQVARTLMAPESQSGWGIRTVATSEVRYNPMSYHNGSIWPHDNALIARGLAHCDLRDEVLTVMDGLFHASLHMDLHRLPELFCGFRRRPGEGPTHYPVACNPQAWAAAAVYQLLQAALGLDIDAAQRTMCFRRARLPECLARVSIRGLRVNDARVDLELERQHADVSINVVRRSGAVEIIGIK